MVLKFSHTEKYHILTQKKKKKHLVQKKLNFEPKKRFRR